MRNMKIATYFILSHTRHIGAAVGLPGHRSCPRNCQRYIIGRKYRRGQFQVHAAACACISRAAENSPICRGVRKSHAQLLEHALQTHCYHHRHNYRCSCNQIAACTDYIKDYSLCASPIHGHIYTETGTESFWTGQRTLVFKLGHPGGIYTPKPWWDLLMEYPPQVKSKVPNPNITELRSLGF